MNRAEFVEELECLIEELEENVEDITMLDPEMENPYSFKYISSVIASIAMDIESICKEEEENENN